MIPRGKEQRELHVDLFEKIEAKYDDEWQVYYAALEYIRLGMYVLPLERNGKAIPYDKGYNINYGSATTKKTTIEKWFHPNGGKFAGWNIGIATGREGGVFAIDVDVHGTIDGFENLKEITDEEGRFDAPMQRTPSGGGHFLFLWQDSAASSTGKLAPAIDTRGGTDISCKGHIVAFPSTINKKKYRWEKSGPILDIPKWVMEKLGVVWQPSSSTGRGNEEMGDDDIERTVPIEQIQRMIDAIDPDDVTYDDWLRIGMSIKSQYPDNDGFAVWDEWSQKGSRYKENECRNRWKGFSETGTVRMGTLFFHATESGWEQERNDVRGNKYDMIVEELNKTYAIVMVGGKIKIIREKTDVIDPILGHYDLIGKEDFRTLLQNDLVWSEGKKPKPMSVADVWLAHGTRRTYPNGMALYPDGAPPGWYNTWNGFAVEPREGKCERLLKHIKEIVCCGRDKDYNWLLDWCADAVQDPANPKGTAIVMRGEEGSGKGTLANTIGKLFGSHYRHLIDDSHLLSNFNAHMIDALFVFADEITWGGNKKTAGKLKGMVTEKYLVGERKGVDAVGYRNMTRMMIASNSDWVIPAGANSRRWFMLDVDKKKANNRSYFDAIQDELKNGGTEAFLYFLLNREVTHDLRCAPKTEALQEQRMRSMAGDTIVQWWIFQVETQDMSALNLADDTEGKWPQWVAKAEMYTAYETWCMTRNNRPEAIAVFYKEITKYGPYPGRPNIRGKRHHAYKIPKIEICQMTLTEKLGITYEE